MRLNVQHAELERKIFFEINQLTCSDGRTTIHGMNWKQLILDLTSRKITLQAIADECGFASKGHVHDLKTGRQATVSYDAGVKLVALHKRVMRRKIKND